MAAVTIFVFVVFLYTNGGNIEPLVLAIAKRSEAGPEAIGVGAGIGAGSSSLLQEKASIEININTNVLKK